MKVIIMKIKFSAEKIWFNFQCTPTHRDRYWVFFKSLTAFQVHIAMTVKKWGLERAMELYLMADKPPHPMSCDLPGINLLKGVENRTDLLAT